MSFEVIGEGRDEEMTVVNQPLTTSWICVNCEVQETEEVVAESGERYNTSQYHRFDSK